MSCDKKEEEMREVVMDWLYTFMRMRSKKDDIEKFICFCKNHKEEYQVSSKRCEKLLKKYENEEWDKWEEYIKDLYNTYL